MDRAASRKIRRLEAESSPSARVRRIVGGKIDPLAANASGPLCMRGLPASYGARSRRHGCVLRRRENKSRVANVRCTMASREVRLTYRDRSREWVAR